MLNRTLQLTKKNDSNLLNGLKETWNFLKTKVVKKHRPQRFFKYVFLNQEFDNLDKHDKNY
jgi:hypothetical protein